MPDPDQTFRRSLAPTHALGGAHPIQQATGGFTVTERSDFFILSVALRKGSQRSELLGLGLPRPGCWHAEDGISALWIGPGQWLFLSRENLHGGILNGKPDFSFTDQSDAWAVLDISWENDWQRQWLFSRLANLSPTALEPGHGTRTLVHHVSCHLVRIEDSLLRILVGRSYAKSFWSSLETMLENAATGRT